jgi:hypothetical protein
MCATYGYRVQHADDPFVILAATTNANLMRAGLSSSASNPADKSHALALTMISDSLVNVIPALKYVPPWFPGAQWKRNALEWRDQKDIMVDKTFNWTKRMVVGGNALEGCMFR